MEFLKVIGFLTIYFASGEDQIGLPDVKITSMHVESNVYARLARVLVTTHVDNYENKSRETLFAFQLPNTAFISNFTMTIGNKVIPGIVKEKATANKNYEESKQQGVSAAKIDHTNQEPNREMKVFTVSVNVAANSTAMFQLQYHELLQRKLGAYTQRILLQPNQIVLDLVFKANIYEQEGIDMFQYKLPGSNIFQTSSSDLTVVRASDHAREFYFKPTIEFQILQDKTRGITDEIHLMYDVLHENIGGSILQQNGYFVHYLAPSGFPVLEKNIIFVIDISGSMRGLKIEQTRHAMISILEHLHEGDFFNVLLFDDSIQTWFDKPLRGTNSNIEAAKTFIRESVHAKGGTNIYGALLKAVEMLEVTQGLGGTRGNIIVFLTDGQPTSGITDKKKIRHSVTSKNKNRFSIFSLGFGFDVDMPFLKTLSWENGGIARRIYEESDASKQLENFYNELNSPTLVDVEVVYQTNSVEPTSLTQSIFPQYFSGSELVIAGKLNNDTGVTWTARVKGRGSKNNLDVETSTTPFGEGVDFDKTVIEKLWAYVKINDLIKGMEVTEDEETKRIFENKIIKLSLKHNFVTPLTSMVVSEIQLPSTENGQMSALYNHKTQRQSFALMNQPADTLSYAIKPLRSKFHAKTFAATASGNDARTVVAAASGTDEDRIFDDVKGIGNVNKTNLTLTFIAIMITICLY